MNVKTCLFLAVCLLVTGVFSASLDAQATLRNHWTFDGNIDDEEGGNIAMGDEPPYVTGFDCAAGGAARFDGVRSLTIDNMGGNQLPFDFSISAWVRLTKAGPSGANFFQGAGIYFGEVTGITADAGFVIIGNSAAFGTGGGDSDATIFATTNIVDGTWHHIAAVRDTTAGEVGQSTLSVYVNGMLESQGISTYDGPISATPQFVLGNALVGDVDDLKVFDGALTQQQLTDLANDVNKADPTTFSRGVSANFLPGGQSLSVTVTATNTAASDIPVTLVETITGGGIVASSVEPGVSIDNENGTVTITFVADGNKSYTLTADGGGCGPGSVTLSGVAAGTCALDPLETSFECPGDLVSHFPFDGDIIDAVSGVEGVLSGMGGPTYVTGASGEPGDQALAFDNDYGVDILNIAPNQFTISCWVRMDQPQNGFFPDGSLWWQGHAVMQGEVAGDVDDAGLTMVGETARFGIGGPDTTVQGVTSLTDGRWHLLTATRTYLFSQSNLRLYVDGQLEAEAFVANHERPVNRHAVWGVGRQAQNRGLTGEIDDVRIYSRPLSDTEIQELFVGCVDNAVLDRSVSPVKIGEGDSSDVTVTATNVAAADGLVTLTETLPTGLMASSADAGVVVDGSTVTLTFDSDGSKSYTITGQTGGCGPGAQVITGSVTGGCVLAPATSSLICLGDLVSHFPLDGNVEDVVGGRDGTLSGNGGPVFTDGLSEDEGDQALRFNNDYGVDIQNVVPHDFSLSLWVRMSAPQADPCCGGSAFWMGHALLQGETTGDVNDSAITVLTDVASFGIGKPDTTLTSSTNLADGEWHHIVATRFINLNSNLSDIVLYVDGSEAASASTTNLDALLSNSVWGLGRQAQNRGLVGDIDDVRLYGRALSSSEVVELFTGCAGALVSFTRELSVAKLDGGDSTVVTVTATDVAAAGGPVTLTDMIPAGLTASSSDDGVNVNNDQVAITFDADGSKTYTLTADVGGCSVGSTITSVVTGNCTVRPEDTRLICLDDLVAHYPFDGSIDDVISGGTPIVSGTGATNTVPGNTGDALRFMNDYGLDIPNTVPDDFTLSCFVRMDAPQGEPCCGDLFWSGHAIFQGETVGNVDDSAVTVLNDVATFGIGNPDTTIKGTANLADGEWHLVTATRSINTATGMSDLVLYVDGVVDASDVAPNTGPLTSNAVWGVGRQAQNRGLNGDIDDVRIYGRALSQEEVQALLGPVGDPFRRGDHDGSGLADITDALNLLGFLFLGTTPPICGNASDFDNSGALDITDALILLGHLFLGQPNALPAPGTSCGLNPDTPQPGIPPIPPQGVSDLGCDKYPGDAFPEAACP